MRVIASACLAFGLILFAQGAAAQETEEERTDRGRITAFLEDSLSGAGREVVLRDFRGALSSRATASQLTIADSEGVWLTINEIVLDWNRASLLAGNFSVNEFSAKEIIVTRAPVSEAPPSPEASGFSLPELPVSVNIGTLTAERIELGESLLGQAVEGRITASASLSDGQGQISLNAERTDDGPDGTIRLDFGYDNGSRRLVFDLDAREGAGGLVAGLLNLPGQPSVALTVQGNGPLEDFSAFLSLATDGQERLNGLVALKAVADEAGAPSGALGFSAELSGDPAPLFLPEYQEFFGNDVSLVAQGERAASGRTDLSRLSVRTRTLKLDGNARLAPDGLSERLDLSGEIMDPTGAPVRLPLSTPVSLRAGILGIGYDSSEGETWRVSLVGEELRLPGGVLPTVRMTGSGRIERRPGNALIGGTLRLSAEGITLSDPALQEAVGPTIKGETRFWWQQKSGALRIGNLVAEGAGLSLAGSAELSGLGSGFRISGNGEAQIADLSRLAKLAGRDLAGAGTVRLSGSGSPLGGDFDLALAVVGRDLALGEPRLDGLLSGESALDVEAARGATGVDLRRLSLRTPSISIDGSGRLASDLSRADVAFSVPNASVMGPDFGGAVSGQARLEGPLLDGQARIEARIDGRDLRVGLAEADRMLSGATGIALKAELVPEGVRIDRVEATGPRFQADLSGLLSAASSDLTGRVSVTDLSGIRPGLGGSFVADLSATGTPQDARLKFSANGRSLKIGQTEADRVLAGATELAGELRLVDGQLRVDRAVLENPQLRASASGRVAGGTRQIDLEARLANLGLLLPDFPGPLTLSGTATELSDGYRVELTGTGPGQINGHVSGEIAGNFQAANLAIKGSAQAGLVNPFLGTRVVSGPVSIDVGLDGPFRPSSLSGRISLSQGRLADPSLPFALEGIGATVTLKQGRASLDVSSRVSTGGTVTVRGGVGLDAPFVADLGVAIAGAVLRDPQLYQTRATGQINISGPLAGGAVISGRIALPETEIRVADTGFGGAGGLPGLEHLNEPAPVRETRRRAGLLADAAAGSGGNGAARPYGLDLTISAPNRLFVRGRGLDAEMGGELRVTGTTDNVVPSGAFSLIRGRLEILGRRLDLTEANLQLEGSFDPWLDILASTNADGLIAGIRIRGLATDPEVTFTSSPPLPQEEVLSQILFGKRLEKLSALQALQLANAVATLAGRGGEGIISRLRRGFGLDDLDVQTSEDGGTQVRAGKYISRNVYSEVIVDQNGKSEISLNLDLSTNVTVRGKLGADGDSGLGIYYEKDY